MLLLGWNFDYARSNTTVYWRTDACLRELSGYYVAMEEVAEMYPPKRAAEKNLFMLPYNPQPANSDIWRKYLQKIMDSIEDPKTDFSNKVQYEKSPALARLG